MKLDRYRDQHDAILRKLGDLLHLIDAGIAEYAEDIARQLATLDAAVSFHFASERSVLLPALRNASHPDAVAMARHYQAELDRLRDACAEFTRRWRDPAQLANDPEGFRCEAGVLFAQLEERIRREHRELYPLVEGL